MTKPQRSLSKGRDPWLGLSLYFVAMAVVEKSKEIGHRYHVHGPHRASCPPPVFPLTNTFHRAKARESERGHSRFRPARQAHVRLSVGNVCVGQPQGVGGRGTGAVHDVVGAWEEETGGMEGG